MSEPWELQKRNHGFEKEVDADGNDINNDD